ncbi:Transmembrane protein [Quillaja saponaria]|uniref:Transmembrane protein n=1 Tax=Quillaja saponaria TaxID=32244 RepID=A0AAD7VFP9_QUISA|nr:Transmembrane protein [Quillaja saponaria]
MSSGVGPTCNDISLPREEEYEHKESYDPSLKSVQKPTSASTTPPKKASFLTFRQLNALAIIIVFSASGMVSLEDFAFLFFSLVYIYFLSKVAFPPLHPEAKEPPIFNPQSKLLRLHMFIGATIGFFLPIAYIFQGILEGDKEGIKAAAPHVFLLASQVFMDGVALSYRFSTPIQVLVPLFYNSRRLLTLMDWLMAEIAKVDEEHSGSIRRLYIGRGLALANMAFWSFNLFGFILPVYLPKAFRMYYSEYKVKD